MTSLPKGVYAKSKQLADGTVKTYHYHRATNTRINGEPGTKEFNGQVAAAERAATKSDVVAVIQQEEKPASPTCWRSVVDAYRASTWYTLLAPATRRWYARQLDRARKFDPVEITELRRREFVIVRDSLQSKPGEANKFIAVMSTVMTYAVKELRFVEYNPLGAVERLPIGTFEPWTDAQIDIALKVFPEWLRRAVILALYTGQRAGDCCKMTWKKYDGKGILVKPQKTKRNPKATELYIPAHPTLRAELDAWRAEAQVGVTILLNRHGRPWSISNFTNEIGETIRRHPEIRNNDDEDKRDTVFHGLRKKAACNLADAGCTTHEIQAITGHASLEVVAIYTQGANQKRLAESAIQKLVKAQEE